MSGTPVILHAHLWSVLADGEGHMKAWDWVGASGLKPCVKHFNVYKKDPALFQQSGTQVGGPPARLSKFEVE